MLPDQQAINNRNALKAKRYDEIKTVAEKQKALIESLDALIEEEMGEWYSVAYSYCPVSLSNLAHMRDAIAEFKVTA